MWGFVAASFVGFWMHRLYTRHGAVLRTSLIITKRRAGVAGTFIVAFAVSASFFDHGRLIAEKLVDTITGGASTRALLGVLLGVVVAYATAGRPIQSSADKPAGAPQNPAAAAAAAGKTPGEHDSTEAADKIPMLPIAGAIVLLALAAPHLDGWFSRLSGLKTSLIEFQLAAISASEHAVRPDRREAIIDDTLFNILRKYDESIERDISYIGLEIRDNKNQQQDIKERGADKFAYDLRRLGNDKKELDRQAQQLRELYELFHNVVSPAAGCFQDAISNGLNMASVRRKLGDVADMLTQLIILEEKEKSLREEVQQSTDAQNRAEITAQLRVASQQLQRHHVYLRIAAAEAPKKIVDFLTQEQRKKCDDIKLGAVTSCLRQYEGPPDLEEVSNSIAVRSEECDGIESVKAEAAASIPYYREYRNLPHLYVARAVLLWFVNNDGLALKVLQEAEDLQKTEKKPFKEFDVPRLLASLKYFQGQSAERFAPILEGMKTTAQERQQLIARVESRCVSPCDLSKDRKVRDELRNRARNAELTAINNLAYTIAEDLAEELGETEALMPTAEEYGEILREAAKGERDRQNKFVTENRDRFLDTAAFVTIVTEAKRKSNSLRKDKVREAAEALEKLVSREESSVRKNPQPMKLDFEALNTYRSHLASARALLRE